MSALGHLFGPEGALASAFPGYEHRPEQIRMAEAVAKRLEEPGVLLVEAGTGTGKTLAYLVPAVLSGKKVVVSTGTKNLQDQIMQHDLPLIRDVLGIPMRVACMKGLTNYVCRRRLEEYRGSEAGLAPDFTFERLMRWTRETATGDRAELGDLAEDLPVWSEIQSSVETRIGARCDHYESCFVTEMRRAAEEADVIVVNHHLFFADLAARAARNTGASVIPDHDAVVLDEAHLAEDVATSFFGLRVSARRISILARDARRGLVSARLLGRDGQGDAALLLSAVESTGAAFFMTLRGGEGRTLLLPEEMSGSAFSAKHHRLDDALDGLAAYLRLHVGRSEAITSAARRASQVRDELATVCDGGLGLVCWSEGRGPSAAVGSSAVDLAEVFRERLFYRVPHVVLTSATLTVGGRYEFLKRRLGIDFEVEELALASPFDYPSQAMLYLPRHLPEPRAPAFVDAVASEAAQLIEILGGGAFVLCTSLRNMRGVHARLTTLLGRPILLQGDRPRHALLEAFRVDGNAVLVATASFWQGVDVPGEALRLVVMDKLPFDVPTDPIIAARARAIEASGGRPFVDYHVPAAALALKQGFGRLIRSRRDRGVVAILDRRVSVKSYGRKFLDGLPPARRTSDLDEVRRFWKEPMLAEASA